MTDNDPESFQFATSADQLPSDDPKDNEDVPAPELDDAAKAESDEQDKILKLALSRRSASPDTDDENLLGLMPNDETD